MKYLETVEFETINWSEQYLYDSALVRWTIVAYFDDSPDMPKEVYPKDFDVFSWEDCTYVLAVRDGGEVCTIVDITGWTDWHQGDN